MTSAAHQEIAHQHRIDSSSNLILTELRLDADEATPIFKRSDIYNAKSRIKRQILGPWTPVQALMQELQREDCFLGMSRTNTTELQDCSLSVAAFRRS